jgi:prevent-host-death family protein
MDNMKTLRSIPASAAKANLGEVLSSLATDGGVEITRNGRPIGILTAPEQNIQATSVARLAVLAPLYSSGAISWHQVSDETGAAFGDLLIELGRQNLQLPRVAAKKRPEQQALLDEVFRRASRSK